MSAERRTAEEIRVPRPALYAAGALIACSILAAAAGRFGYVERVAVQEAPVVESRTLLFHPMADGGLAVFDVDAGKVLEELPPGQAGFVNGVLRGLSHQRRVQNAPPEAPYKLILTATGRLALVDTWTEVRVELRGFGADNDAAFAKLMALGSETR